MTILSPKRDQKAYYKKQAEDLRKRAADYRQDTDNYPEAKRLEELAKDADYQAQAIDEELRSAGE